MGLKDAVRKEIARLRQRKRNDWTATLLERLLDRVESQEAPAPAESDIPDPAVYGDEESH